MTNKETIMRLADAYAAVSTGAVPDADRYKIGLRIDEARAALEAALDAAGEPVTPAQERMIADFPALAQFHTKYALGPMLPPSCLCCGQQTHPYSRPIAVKHLELPGIVICKECKDKTTTASHCIGGQK